MRGRELAKLLKAVDLMARPQGVSVLELAEHLEVSKRSVYRELELMEELGFPIYQDESLLGTEKRWKFQREYLKKLPNLDIPDMKLQLSELVALCLLRSEAGLFKGTGIEKDMESAFAKLGAFLPEKLFKNLGKVRALFVASRKFAKDYKGKEQIIDDLTQAMLEQRTCLVRYNSFSQDRVTGFKIDPLHFFEHGGGLYLFVRATSFGDIRMLAVERIQEITLTDSRFDYPEDFDPEARLAEAFDLTLDDPIAARIRFSADQAKYIKERQFAQDQQITDQDDGSIVLAITTSGGWDLKRWVLSFGAEAEVLEPAELRREIADTLTAMRELYPETA
ncbi:MAG: WYL domain-containing protein [Thermodesulfobacteriota bacterium]